MLVHHLKPICQFPSHAQNFVFKKSRKIRDLFLLMGLHKQGSSSKAELLIIEYLVVVSVTQ